MTKLVAAILVTLASLCGADTRAALGQQTTGLIFATDEQLQGIPFAPRPLGNGQIPRSVDLARHFPPPGDQGMQSSCVGWAIAYALKSYQEAREHEWPVGNPSHQFSPAYVYNQIKPPGNCDTGSSFADALNLLQSEGVAPLSVFPYSPVNCSKRPTPQEREQADQYRIAQWRRVNVRAPEEIKAQLAGGFPVLVGMVVGASFMNHRGSGVYEGHTGELGGGGHAMVIVGYDDDRKAFRLINSWGRSWGDDGYAWVSYATVSSLGREAYTAQDIVIYSPPPSEHCHDDQQWNGSRCIDRCRPSQKWDGDRCVERCDDGEVWKHERCESRCPDGTLWADGDCVSQCEPDERWDAREGRCAPKCPPSKQWSGTGCVSRCTAGEQWDDSLEECLPRCDESERWNGDRCVSRCTRQEFWDGSECVPREPRRPQGLPSGSALGSCGCWGLPPVGAVNDRRCESGLSFASPCVGMCPLGGSPWTAICQ